jgi:hypothetical protein
MNCVIFIEVNLISLITFMLNHNILLNKIFLYFLNFNSTSDIKNLYYNVYDIYKVKYISIDL